MGKRGPKPLTLDQVIERFLARIEPDGDCQVYAGAKTDRGYGLLHARGVNPEGPIYAHVLAWFIYHGGWPTGEICHSCDNPPCVKDEHLFEGTHQQNMLDCQAKGRLKIGGRTSATWSKGDNYQTRQAAKELARAES